MLGLPPLTIEAIVLGLVLIVPLWRICRRAGIDPFWALLVFAPFIGIPLVLLVLALAPWPNRSTPPARGPGP